jgi:hypothetical protein
MGKMLEVRVPQLYYVIGINCEVLIGRALIEAEEFLVGQRSVQYCCNVEYAWKTKIQSSSTNDACVATLCNLDKL